MDKEACRSIMNQFGLTESPFFFLIDYELEHCQVYQLGLIPSTFHIQFPEIEINTIDKKSNNTIALTSYPLDYDTYKISFDLLQSHLKYGNSFLANLTCSTKIDSNCTINELYVKAQSKYKLLIENTILCFSPETFVTIQNDKISSYPMKGTIDADIPNAEDIVLQDIKEQEEHNTIVDLIRNDLSIVADKVHLIRHRYLNQITTQNKSLLQVSSEIVGTLKTKLRNNLGDIIFSLLPAGSISGAPKTKTIKILNKIEGQKRGYYTGIMGIFDGISVDTCVLIRFIDKKGSQLYYRSGGGITHRSKAENEYQEMLDKIYVPIN